MFGKCILYGNMYDDFVAYDNHRVLLIHVCAIAVSFVCGHKSFDILVSSTWLLTVGAITDTATTTD